MEKPRISPIIAITGAILAVSTASIFIRFCQIDGMPSLAIAAYRMVLASLIIAPFAIWKSKAEIRSISARNWILIVLAGLLLAFHFASWITSLGLTSVASSVVLVTTAPLWVALFSPLLLKENLTLPIIIGLVIAMIGSTVVGLNEACTLTPTLSCPPIQDFIAGKAFLGNLLALAGALFSAGYLIVGRKARGSLSLLTYVFLVYTVSAIFLVGIVLITETPITTSQPFNYLWLVLLALIPQVIGHSTLNWALKYLSAAYVAIALLGEPIGTVILAFIILKEKLTILEIVGGLLILGGIYLASQVEGRRLPALS